MQKRDKFVDPRSYIRNGKLVNPKRHKRRYNLAKLIGTGVGAATIGGLAFRKRLKTLGKKAADLLENKSNPFSATPTSAEAVTSTTTSVKGSVTNKGGKRKKSRNKPNSVAQIENPFNQIDNTPNITPEPPKPNPIRTSPILLIPDKGANEIKLPSEKFLGKGFRQEAYLKRETEKDLGRLILTEVGLDNKILEGYGFNKIDRSTIDTLSRNGIKSKEVRLLGDTLYLAGDISPAPINFVNALDEGFNQVGNRFIKQFHNSNDELTWYIKQALTEVYEGDNPLAYAPRLKEIVRQSIWKDIYDSNNKLKEAVDFISDPRIQGVYNSTIVVKNTNALKTTVEKRYNFKKTLQDIKKKDGEYLPPWMVLKALPDSDLEDYKRALDRNIADIRKADNIKLEEKKYLINEQKRYYDYLFLQKNINKRKPTEADIAFLSDPKVYTMDSSTLDVLYRFSDFTGDASIISREYLPSMNENIIKVVKKGTKISPNNPTVIVKGLFTDKGLTDNDKELLFKVNQILEDLRNNIKYTNRQEFRLSRPLVKFSFQSFLGAL
jgi:hypothetical protein